MWQNTFDTFDIFDTQSLQYHSSINIVEWIFIAFIITSRDIYILFLFLFSNSEHPNFQPQDVPNQRTSTFNGIAANLKPAYAIYHDTRMASPGSSGMIY